MFTACTVNEPIEMEVPDFNKHISGSIDNNKYYAMDNSFTISLPYKKGTKEYALMDIDEFYYENGSNIAFIGKDKSVYSLEMYKLKKESNDFNSFEAKSLKLLFKYHKNIYKSIAELKALKKERIKIDGKSSIHWDIVLKPKKYSKFDAVRHHIFAIKLEQYIVIVMVGKSVKKPVEESFLSAYNFAYSLSLLE